MAEALKVGDVLKHRGSPATARVCRLSTFTVMFELEGRRFYTIPWSAVWKTFERPHADDAVARPGGDGTE